MSTPLPLRLSSVQALRALAALMVLAMHLEGNIAFITGTFPRFFYWFCFSGVDLFFAISGFVMVYAHAADAGSPARAVRFLQLRYIRIFPNYWLIAAYGLLLMFLIDYRSDAPKLDVVRSFILWPQDTKHHLLPVAWTLNFELLFYFIFAALLCLPQRLFTTALTLWGIIILVAQGWVDYTPHFSWQNFLLSAYHLQFLAGAAAALLFVHLPAKSGMPWLKLGLALWLATMLLSTYVIDGSLLHRTERMLRGVLLASSFGPILFGLAQMNRQKLPLPGFIIRLGDASYTLYLLHLPLLALWMWCWVNLFGTGGGGVVAAMYVGLYVILCLIVSLWHWRHIERPLTRRLRRIVFSVNSAGELAT